MPFEAAKALAATFCWRIRYVLTPMFGTDFPALCIPPTDRARFTRMIIDPEIVRRAAETANRYRALELQNYTHSLTGGSENGSTTSPSPRRTRELDISFVDSLPSRQLFPKLPRHRYTDSIGSERDSSSEPYCVSPQSPTGSTWTPVNRPPPRSSDIVPRSRVPSPRHFYRHAAELRGKRLSAEECESEVDLSSESQSDAIRTPEFSSTNEDTEMGKADSGPTDVDSSESFSEMSLSEEGEPVDEDDEDEDYREPNNRASVGNGSPSEKERLKKNPARSVKTKTKRQDRVPGSGHFAHEVKAAHALLRLHMQEATSEDLENDALTDESICCSSLGLAFRPSNAGLSRKRRHASL